MGCCTKEFGLKEVSDTMSKECTAEDIERGKRLRLLREQTGQTQAEAADRAGVSTNTFNGWEHGKKISVKNKYNLCKEYHVPYEVLGESTAGLISARTFQMTYLRKLGLCPVCEQKVEEAINRYYDEKDT